MPSDYTAFDVLTQDGAGVRTPVPNQTVKVRNVTGSADLSDLTTNADGHIPAGTLAVAAGTLIRFSADLGDGRKGYAEQETT